MARTAEGAILLDGELEGFCTTVRDAGGQLVLTNGCFDVFHAGHADFLQAAAAFGDVLLVGVNDDASVASLKGEGRPILPVDDRIRLVSAIRWVDAVVVFREREAERLIERTEPHVYVKGSDYDVSQGGNSLPELLTLERLGISVQFVPITEGRSSTNILVRARRPL